MASCPIDAPRFQRPLAEDATKEAAVDVSGLPRLRGKQRPRGGWEAVPAKAWVLEKFDEWERDKKQSDDNTSMDVGGAGAESGPANL